MKRPYEKPLAELFSIRSQDVIATSGGGIGNETPDELNPFIA